MLKKLINIGLATTIILGSLGTISYAAQTPILPNFKNNIAQTSIKASSSSIVTEGFEKLCSGQTKDAFNLWLSHSIPPLRDRSTQITVSFASMPDTMIGKCNKYTMIGSVSLTTNTQVVYILSEHEKAPLFWQFVVYQTPQDWEIASIRCSTDPHEIIPPSMFDKSKQTLVTHHP